MGTRAIIAVNISRNVVVSAYCHYDGGIMDAGKTLVIYHNTLEEVQELVSGGYMRGIYDTLESTRKVTPENDEIMATVTGQTLKADNFGAEFVYWFINGDWYWTEEILEEGVEFNLDKPYWGKVAIAILDSLLNSL